LKAELAAQKEAAKERRLVQKQLDASEAKVDDLQTKITDLTKSLSESRTEIKALNMKLAAARTAEAAAVAKVPGSAIKGTVNRGNSEAIQQATRAAQLKEMLYGDLTGLIVTAVKTEADDRVGYDCIQTGANGGKCINSADLSPRRRSN
jgi:predicted RNase H-like nuclease (RuvC/YqgF family)